MTFTQKTFIALAGFLVPAAVLAAAPGNITGVNATISNGALTVTWSPVTGGTPAAFYRVYYSHQSILGNGGNYDDFERTTGPETTYTFRMLPVQSGTVYIGVLAVGADGTESEGFETEATVQVSAPVTPASAAPAAPVTNIPVSSGTIVGTTAIPMTLSAVTPVSSTGVIVTFSKPILATARFSLSGFTLTESGGGLVRILDIRMDGANLLFVSDPMKPGTPYILNFATAIPADDGTSMPVGMPPVLFLGFGSKAPLTPTVVTSSSPSSASASSMPALPTEPAKNEGVKEYIRTPLGIVGRTIDDNPDVRAVSRKPLTNSGPGLLFAAVPAGLVALRKVRRRTAASC